MDNISQHFRVYVIGTRGKKDGILPQLQKLSGDGATCCFGTIEKSHTDLASGLRGNTAYDCVLFLISDLEEDLRQVFTDFKRIVQQGLPTYAVLTGQALQNASSDSASVQLTNTASPHPYLNSRLLEIQRIALRLGAAGVFHIEAITSLSRYLTETLAIQEKSDLFLRELEDPLSYIQELQRSELRYRNLVQLSRDLIWSLDAEGRWIFINDAVFDILGYQPKELIGHRFTEFQDPQDAARDLITFSNIMEGVKYFDYETRYRTKTGSQVTLSFNALVALDEHGVATGTSGTAVDISSKKRTGEELKSQKEFFRQIVDANPNRISVRNLSGQFILANKAFAKTLQYDPDDLIGLTYQEVISDPAMLRLLDIHDDQLKINGREEIIFESRGATRDVKNSPRYFQTTRKALYVPGKQEPYLLEVSVDLTKQKRFEESLRYIAEGTAGVTAEEYFPSLLEHLTSALKMPAGVIYALDEQKKQFTPIAKYPSKLFPKISTISTDDPLLDPLLRRNLLYTATESKNLLPESLQDTFSTMLGCALRVNGDDAIGMLLIYGNTTITDNDLAEYLLPLFSERASTELLYLTKAKQMNKLERQLLQAQKMEAIGTLAAGAAHDLNNALGAIQGHLELLEESTALPLDEKNSLHTAIDGCSRASQLVHQLLGFSRQDKHLPINIPLPDELQEMIVFLNCATPAEIKINIVDIPDTMRIYADQSQFQQILMNLIINAQQAMPDGGQVTIRATSEFVAFPQQFNSQSTPGEYSVIHITDTGHGIPSDIQEKIFEPFFTTKDAEKGTGLGLSMAYGIMQHHGGWIHVDSSSDEGCTFRLFFPKMVVAPEDSDSPIIQAQPSEQQRTILVIDDEPFLVDLTCRFLKKGGFIPKGFTNPQEALQFFEAHRNAIHLTILDMKMPRLDGKSCFLKLRQIQEDAQVVILSGCLHDENAQFVMDNGALKYFQKPLKYSDLIAWIKQRFQQTLLDTPKTARFSPA